MKRLCYDSKINQNKYKRVVLCYNVISYSKHESDASNELEQDEVDHEVSWSNQDVGQLGLTIVNLDISIRPARRSRPTSNITSSQGFDGWAFDWTNVMRTCSLIFNVTSSRPSTHMIQ